MQKFYSTQPIVDRTYSKPNKIIDLKFYFLPTNPIDVVDFEDRLQMRVVSLNYPQERNVPTHLVFEATDLETGDLQNFIIDVSQEKYAFWEKFAQKLKEVFDGTDETPDFAFSNYRLVVTPVNNMGEGPNSVFFLPLKNTIVEFNLAGPTFYRNDNFFKNWPLFSPTPNEIKYRPKVMHIYLNVEQSDIEADKILLGEEQWKFTGIGNWQITNQNQYRWLVTDEHISKLDENDTWLFANKQEEEYITFILEDVSSFYRQEMDRRNLLPGDPFVFKMAIMNPMDKYDIIFLYIMKEMRWEL